VQAEKLTHPTTSFYFCLSVVAKKGTLIVRITDMTSVGQCGMNSVHDFLIPRPHPRSAWLHLALMCCISSLCLG